jgi:hypothetical protein
MPWRACEGKQRCKRMKKVFFFCFIFFLPSFIWANDLPSYKIAGRDRTSLSILVPPDATKNQIRELILEFRRARHANTLSSMIPPTTPGEEYGNYAVIVIFIFSEPRWASAAKLRDYWNPGVQYSRPKSSNKPHREYEKHIRGEYYYSIGSGEYGSVGYSDQVFHTKDYKRLF